MHTSTSAMHCDLNETNIVYPTASFAIGKCIKQFVMGELASYVVKTAAGIMLFNSFQMKVRSSEIHQVIFSIDKGNTLLVNRGNTLKEAA